MLGWFFFIGPVSASRWWVHFIGTMIATAGLGFAIFLDVAMFTTLAEVVPVVRDDARRQPADLPVHAVALAAAPGGQERAGDSRPRGSGRE